MITFQFLAWRTRESRHNTGCLKTKWALSPITWLGVTYLKSPGKLSKLMARRPRRMPIKTKWALSIVLVTFGLEFGRCQAGSWVCIYISKLYCFEFIKLKWYYFL